MGKLYSPARRAGIVVQALCVQKMPASGALCGHEHDATAAGKDVRKTPRATRPKEPTQRVAAARGASNRGLSELKLHFHHAERAVVLQFGGRCAISCGRDRRYVA